MLNLDKISSLAIHIHLAGGELVGIDTRALLQRAEALGQGALLATGGVGAKKALARTVGGSACNVLCPAHTTRVGDAKPESNRIGE